MSQHLFRDRGTSLSRPMTAAQRAILAQTKRDNPVLASNDAAYNDNLEAYPASSGLLAHIQSVISSPPAPQRPNQHNVSIHHNIHHSYNPPQDSRPHFQQYSAAGQDSPYKIQAQQHSDGSHAFTYDDADEHWSDADTLSSARSPRYSSFAHTEPTPYSPGSSSSLATHEEKHPQHNTPMASHNNLTNSDNHTYSAREVVHHPSTPLRRSLSRDLDTPQPAPAPASRLAARNQQNHNHQQQQQHQQEHQSSPSFASPPLANSNSTSTSLNFYYPPPSDSPSAEQRRRLAAVLRAHTQPPPHPTHPPHPAHLATQHHHDNTVPHVTAGGLHPHGQPASDNAGSSRIHGVAGQPAPGPGPVQVQVQGRLPLPLTSAKLATRAHISTHTGNVSTMNNSAISGSGAGTHGAATRPVDTHADFTVAAAHSMLPRSSVVQTLYGDGVTYPHPNFTTSSINPAATDTSVTATAPASAIGASTTAPHAGVSAAVGAGAPAGLSVAERLRRRTIATTHSTAHADDGERASVAVTTAPPPLITGHTPGTTTVHTIGTTTDANNITDATATANTADTTNAVNTTSTNTGVNATSTNAPSVGRRAATPTRMPASETSGVSSHVTAAQTAARAPVPTNGRAPTSASTRSHADKASGRTSASVSASRTNPNINTTNGNVTSSSTAHTKNATRSKANTTTTTTTTSNVPRPTSGSTSISTSTSTSHNGNPYPQRPTSPSPPSPPTPEPRRFLPHRTRPATHPATHSATHAVAQPQPHSAPSALPPPASYEVSPYGQQLLRAIHDPVPIGGMVGHTGMTATTGTTGRAEPGPGVSASIGVSADAGASTGGIIVDGSGAGHSMASGQYVGALQQGYHGSMDANNGAGADMSSPGTSYGELAVTHSLPRPPSGFARNVNTEASVHNDVAVDTGAFTQRLRVPAVNMTMGNLWRELEHDNRQLNSVNKELLLRIEALEGALHERTAMLGEVTARAEQAEGRCVALERVEAKMREEKGQFMRAITEQAGLLGQSKSALETLQAGVEALKSRLEDISGAKEAVVAQLEEVKGECKGIEKERNTLKNKLDKAQETIVNTEAAKAELENHVKVLKQAEKTKSRQLSTALLEKRRYMEAFERALTFVKSKHIPSTVGEGGLRLQKLLLELLRIDDDDMRGRDKNKEEKESSDRAREALLRRLRADTESSRGSATEETQGIDEGEASEGAVSPHRAGHGVNGRYRIETGKQRGDDALLQLLEPSKDTARASKSGMSSMGISGTKDNGRGSKLSLRERLQQQTEYISSLQATVRTLRDQNLTLTQRFRVAAEEKKKLQRKLERLERQTYYPQGDEDGPEELPGEEPMEHDTGYYKDLGYNRDAGYEDAVYDVDYDAPTTDHGVKMEEYEDESAANDSVSFLLRRSTSPARVNNNRNIDLTTAATSTPTAVTTPATTTNAHLRASHSSGKKNPSGSGAATHDSWIAANVRDVDAPDVDRKNGGEDVNNGSVDGDADMVQWRNAHNVDYNAQNLSTYNQEFPQGGYNPDSYGSFSQSYNGSNSHYAVSHGMNNNHLDAIDADYHTLLSAASGTIADAAHASSSSKLNPSKSSPPPHGLTQQAAGIRNSRNSADTSVSGVMTGTGAVTYGEDDVYARALTELHQSLALLDGNNTHENNSKRGKELNEPPYGEDDDVEYDIDKVLSKTSTAGMKPIRETERNGLGNPLLVHLSGEVAAMSTMTTRSNPFYQPRQ